MKRRIHTLLGLAGLCLVLLSVGGVAADSEAARPEVIPPGLIYPARDFSEATHWAVVRVIGPDRLIIKNDGKQRTVRLIGVAEGQTNWPKPILAGDHSKTTEFLSNLLSGEQVFILEPQSDIAAAGLDTVKLFRVPDGLYVNLELVRQGYAQLSPVGLGAELSLFGTYQQRAKLSGKGLWSKTTGLTATAKQKSKVTVCVTKAGKRYHRDNCQFLAKSKIPLNLSEAKARGFTPCRICRPPE